MNADRRPSPLREYILAALFAALTAVLALLTIPLPFSLVPVTGQSFGVMVAGALLGSRTAMLSQILYLVLGLVGLPVFAGGAAGPGAFVGPAGGYLWGFVAGAFVIGRLMEAHTHPGFPWRVFALAVGGVLVVYVPGVLQLALVADLPLPGALSLGAFPFLPGDILKVLAAALVAQKLNLRSRKTQIPYTP